MSPAPNPVVVRSPGAAAGGRVVFDGNAGGGFFAEADVVSEAGQVLVARLGLQLGCGTPGLGEVLERGVA
ncbi:hypothetical protein [Frankia sp. CiP3]|uniref:hypothetical protein n=1 Tax=Frankia sp. CiP3 TaxID=2880971 RepID=UPI001EF4BEFF|nr:hypothetical protein [Frankia sp. CiP3]